jgi:hypothetical protein
MSPDGVEAAPDQAIVGVRPLGVSGRVQVQMPSMLVEA